MNYWYDDFFGCIDLREGKRTSANSRKLAKYKNQRAWQMFFSWCAMVAMYRYRIRNLANTCSERVILTSMLWNCGVAFFKLNNSLMALPCTPLSGPSFNGDFARGHVYARNGFGADLDIILPGQEEFPQMAELVAGAGSKPPKVVTFEGAKLEVSDAVYVRENNLNYPFISFCFEYAEEMADSWRKLSVARQNAAVPFVIFAEEQEKKTVEATLDMMSDNVRALAFYSKLGPDRYRMENINIQAGAMKDHEDVIDWYQNRFCELCFISVNSQPDKKERITIPELQSGSPLVKFLSENTLKTIQEGLDRANKVFGTNMEVYVEGEEEMNHVPTADIRGLDKGSTSGDMGGAGSGVD